MLPALAVHWTPTIEVYVSSEKLSNSQGGPATDIIHCPDLLTPSPTSPLRHPLGKVHVAAEVSLWFGRMTSSDNAAIIIWARTRVQDLTVIRSDTRQHGMLVRI